MPHPPVLRAAAIGLALAACESATGSEPLHGIYSVQTVEGRPLPAALDTLHWTDGVTYTVDRLVAGSVHFTGRDTAQYTWSQRSVRYGADGDSLASGRCFSISVGYRVRQDRLLLIVPALRQGERLRIDTLQIGRAGLEQTIRTASGKAVRLEYAPATQAPDCGIAAP